MENNLFKKWLFALIIAVVLSAYCIVVSGNANNNNTNFEVTVLRATRDSLEAMNNELLMKLDKSNSARQYWYETAMLYQMILEKGIEKQNINTRK